MYDWTAPDSEHLAEEVEELQKTERKAMRSHLGLLWLHLLTWAYQPQGRERYGASRQVTITYTRAFLERSLEDNPSLKPELFRLAAEVYPWPRQHAARESRLPLATFPEEPPEAWSRFRMTNSCRRPEQSTEAQTRSGIPWAAQR